MRLRTLFAICLVGLLPREGFAQLKAVQYASGFTSPIAFIQDPSNPTTQFVVQQNGIIKVVQNGVVRPTNFLDISGSILSGGEQGLLGMAVAPDYGTSGRFFVYFNSPGGDIVVARYRRNQQDPLTADPTSRFDLFWSTNERLIRHPTYGNHNGGNIAFGPDGYLYIGTGDGGSGNDPDNNAQNMSSLLGKMLRIDVNVADTDPKGFAVPPTNPFAGSIRPEIWSIGLRNPWRWSFDNPGRGGTGALLIGDVGQNQREEIDFEPANTGARNYGWRIREGSIATPGVPATTPAFVPLTNPIFDYGRPPAGLGTTVTGGYVYRGATIPALAGRYVFADFGSGRIFSLALTYDGAGEATASDLQEHTAQLGGSHFVSTFGVDANGELYFANYVTGIIYRIESSGPIITASRSSLGFGAQVVNQAFRRQTPPQTIRLSQSGAGTVTWNVSSDRPWLVVSPTSGTGSGTLTVSVQASASINAGANSGTLTFTYNGGSGPAAIAIRLDAFPANSGPPIGSFDTPAPGAIGLSGSIAVTGWSIDDIEVTRVQIWRDPVAGEAPGGLVFIGNATFVEDARPDVQATYPLLPMSSRAGWGYLLLTNFLPDGGNGTFRLHAIAEDGEGNASLLGSKTIGVDNAHALAPFGAIDTPSQGEVVSGTIVNFGWVLARTPRRADPPGNGVVQVVIDGQIMPFVPTGWTSRSDISTLFSATEYVGVGTAVGHAFIDTTTLSNGLHTISWVVTDNLGNAAGIGSRYFTVSNGASLTQAASSSQSPGTREVMGRRGFDPYAAYESFQPDADGRITISIPELGRVELWLGHGASAHALTPAGHGALPIGSHLDADTGRFTWNPGAGFVGAYDFVFNGRNVRIVVGDR